MERVRGQFGHGEFHSVRRDQHRWHQLRPPSRQQLRQQRRYHLSGSGLLSAPVEYVGYSGTGTFTQSGGTNSIGNDLYLGANAGSSGTYILSGSGLLSAAGEYVGAPGTASFLQSGGTNTTSLLAIGSSGSYLLAGGLLQVNGSF